MSVAENLQQATSPGRLTDVSIRPALPRDATLLYQWRSEPSVRQHQPLTHLSLAQLRAELANQSIDNLYRNRGDRFQWVVKAPDPVGWVTLVVANWEHGLAEIGYALSTRHQRRGIMRCALEILLAELFADTGLRRLEARCAVQNQASQKVLESLGFRREGTLRRFFVLRGKPVDNHLYALLRGEWTGELSSRDSEQPESSTDVTPPHTLEVRVERRGSRQRPGPASAPPRPDRSGRPDRGCDAPDRPGQRH